MAPMLRRFDSDSVDDIVPALADLYAEVYAEPPYFEGAEEVREFRARFAEQRREPAFLLTAVFDAGGGPANGDRRADSGGPANGNRADRLIGYLYGFRIDPDAQMWDTLLIRTASSWSGQPLRRPTAYVSELLVRADARCQGVARRLHDAFLSERRESQAALLAHPEATAAQAAYSAWGWKKVGYGRPFPGPPDYETLMLFLS